MTTLRFDIAEVRNLIAVTRKANAYQTSFLDLLDPECWKAGATPDELGIVTPDEIDPAKLTPKLWLVKDEGCYLMSNAADQETDAEGRLKVAYAHGFCKDASHSLLRQALGGDDFVEALDLASFEAAVAEPAAAIIIEIDENQISIMSEINPH